MCEDYESISEEEDAMALRHITFSYEFRDNEPSGGQEEEIRQAFAELGWKMTYYGGGSSNVHKCSVDLEAEDRTLDQKTMHATLTRLGIPTGDDSFIHGDGYVSS